MSAKYYSSSGIQRLFSDQVMLQVSAQAVFGLAQLAPPFWLCYEYAMLLFMFKYRITKTIVLRISQCLGYKIQILTCELDFDFSFPHRHWVPYSYIDHTGHVIHTTVMQELFLKYNLSRRRKEGNCRLSLCDI